MSAVIVSVRVTMSADLYEEAKQRTNLSSLNLSPSKAGKKTSHSKSFMTSVK